MFQALWGLVAKLLGDKMGGDKGGAAPPDQLGNVMKPANPTMQPPAGTNDTLGQMMGGQLNPHDPYSKYPF